LGPERGPETLRSAFSTSNGTPPRLLRAALGLLSLEPREPELRRLHDCFDTWRGIGDVVAGMARADYDLELRRYNGRGWRAIFFQSGF
jgi:hypothetical protein